MTPELRALGERLRELSRNLRLWGPGVVGAAITGMENVADRLDALADEAETHLPAPAPETQR